MKKVLVTIGASLLLSGNLFAQTVTSSYDPNRLPRFDMKEGSRITGHGLKQPSGTTSAFSDYYGTQGVTGSGTTGRIGTTTGLPEIRYSLAGKILDFLGFDGGIKINGALVGTTTQSYLDANFVKNVQGTGTDCVFEETTINAGTLSGTTSVSGALAANGANISPEELSFLDNLSSNVQTQISGKQNDLGGNYVSSLSDDVQGTSTGSVRVGVSGDLTLSYSNGKWIFGETGSATPKADIRANGSNVVNSATFLNFLSPLTAATSSTGADIDIDESLVGTSTATMNSVVRSYSGTGTISQDWIAPVYAFIYRTTTKTVPNITWTIVEMDADSGTLYNATHTVAGSSTVVVNKGGVFKAQGFASIRMFVGSAAIRLSKNAGIEIPGSWAMNYQNFGDSNTNLMLHTPEVHFRLNSGDSVRLEIQHNSGVASDILGYSFLAGMLPPTGSVTAGISIEKIGE